MNAHANPVKNKMAQGPASDRELVLTRVYNAPARIVYEAWTKPQHIKRWFGPVGYPVTTANMDFRVGGKWICCRAHRENSGW